MLLYYHWNNSHCSWYWLLFKLPSKQQHCIPGQECYNCMPWAAYGWLPLYLILMEHMMHKPWYNYRVYYWLNYINKSLICIASCLHGYYVFLYCCCRSECKSEAVSRGAPSMVDWGWVVLLSLSVHFSSWFSGWESLETRLAKDGLPDVSGCLCKPQVQ